MSIFDFPKKDSSGIYSVLKSALAPEPQPLPYSEYLKIQKEYDSAASGEHVPSSFTTVQRDKLITIKCNEIQDNFAKVAKDGVLINAEIINVSRDKTSGYYDRWYNAYNVDIIVKETNTKTCVYHDPTTRAVDKTNSHKRNRENKKYNNICNAITHTIESLTIGQNVDILCGVDLSYKELWIKQITVL